MSSLTKAYASSLFSLAEDENLIEVIMEQLSEIKALIDDNRDYAKLLDSPTISLENRLALAQEAFSSAHEYVVNFIKILCEKKCIHLFPGCVNEYRKLYNKKNNIENVTVITAVPLSPELEKRLCAKLSRESGKKIVLDPKVDKSILGGLILRTENSQTDASLRNRLESIKAQLASEQID